MLTQEQLELRRSGIGASEVASVLGLPAFRSPLDVWNSKQPGYIAPTSVDLRRGDILEPAIAQMYAEREGVALDLANTLRHPKCKVLLATPDRIAWKHGRGEYPVELKSARWQMRQEYGEEGTDRVPVQYLIQVHVQMMVTGLKTADLAALVGGTELLVYRFAYDEKLSGQIIEGVERFWRNYVATGKPPPVDGSDAWVDRLASLPRSRKVLPASDEIKSTAEALKLAKRVSRQAQEDEQRLRNELIALMGDADEVEGVATYREQKGRLKIDYKGLVEAIRPEETLIRQFTTIGNGFRTLRLKGSKDE